VASTCGRSRTEQFDISPAQTYVKGFLRSYAEYLGLDGQLYVDEYNSRFVIGEEEVPGRRALDAPPRRRRGESRSSRASFSWHSWGSAP
jgi:cytoskeletal protein RodZ